MKNKVILICGILVLVVLLGGYYNKVNVKKEVKFAEIEKQLKNVQSELDSIKEEKELRKVLESKLYRFIRYWENGNIEEMKKMVTNNVIVSKDKIINNYTKTELTLIPGNYFLEHNFSVKIDRDEVTYFETVYFMNYDKRIDLPKEATPELSHAFFVDFALIDGEWKLNRMEISLY